jgi:hypothetical protein
MMALTVLSVTFAGIGWVITSAQASTQLAKQRSTAAGIVQLVDTQLQNNLPNEVNLAAAQSYVTGLTGTSVISNPNTQSTSFTVSTSSVPASLPLLLTVTITVSWKSAVRSSTTATFTGHTQVAYA